MKRLFIVLVTMFAFSGFAISQTETPATPPADDKNAPEISFVTVSHDFGTIPYDGNGTFQFEFKNTGKEPLVLTDVHASCGCTTPEWPKQPIKKGEKAVITVKFNTKIVGPFNKSVFVTSNGKTSKVTLTIKGTVVNNDKQGNS